MDIASSSGWTRRFADSGNLPEFAKRNAEIGGSLRLRWIGLIDGSYNLSLAQENGRLLVHADTGVHPDLLNSRFGYASLSRASHEATLFTDDMNRLAPQLGAHVSKTSALDVSQTPSIVQGTGIM
jgi:hypothetical protein